MNEPKWLSRKDVEALHDIAIERNGGALGLRDANLLESAIARPQNLHAYGEDSRFQLAASYAEGIACNHAFVDGNKRTALAAAMMFLHDNGYETVKRLDDGYVTTMVDFAQGIINREQMADYLRDNSRKLERDQSRSSSSQEENPRQPPPKQKSKGRGR